MPTSMPTFFVRFLAAMSVAQRGNKARLRRIPQQSEAVSGIEMLGSGGEEGIRTLETVTRLRP